MSDKEDKQSRLIKINNLCACFSVAIEKHYSTPSAAESVFQECLLSSLK